MFLVQRYEHSGAEKPKASLLVRVKYLLNLLRGSLSHLPVLFRLHWTLADLPLIRCATASENFPFLVLTKLSYSLPPRIKRLAIRCVTCQMNSEVASITSSHYPCTFSAVSLQLLSVFRSHHVW